ncbi:hypothetical protein B0H10DRAFT_1940368 [Mycena sp. CBHHK59/15]|nr:hypothetical protein B0H10DRAFT_1940368 [Mycena sp. CBHHK59/15]
MSVSAPLKNNNQSDISDGVVKTEENPTVLVRTDSESDTAAAKLITEVLGSDFGSMPALTDASHTMDEDTTEACFWTAEEIEGKASEIKEWAELVCHAEGVMAVQLAMCEEAELLIPPHCTHPFYDLRSLERRTLFPSLLS